MEINSNIQVGRTQVDKLSQPGSVVSNDSMFTGNRKQVEQNYEKKYSRNEMEEEVDALNKWLQSSGTHLKFTLHDKLNEYYVQVINDETNEVIREIPSKKVMDIAAKMREMIGLLVDERR